MLARISFPHIDSNPSKYKWVEPTNADVVSRNPSSFCRIFAQSCFALEKPSGSSFSLDQTIQVFIKYEFIWRVYEYCQQSGGSRKCVPHIQTLYERHSNASVSKSWSNIWKELWHIHGFMVFGMCRVRAMHWRFTIRSKIRQKLLSRWRSFGSNDWAFGENISFLFAKWEIYERLLQSQRRSKKDPWP